MGQRPASETVAAILQSFLRQRTWTQAELARAIGVGVPAVKKHLEALEKNGVPFDREEDHPHVYWSVPQDWFPGGVLFAGPDLEILLRQLARLPRSKDRQRLFEIAAECLRGTGQAAKELPRVVSARDESEPESKHLGVNRGLSGGAAHAPLPLLLVPRQRGLEAPVGPARVPRSTCALRGLLPSQPNAEVVPRGQCPGCNARS